MGCCGHAGLFVEDRIPLCAFCRHTLHADYLCNPGGFESGLLLQLNLHSESITHLAILHLFYSRCYPEGCAAPGEVPCQCNARGSPSKLKRAPPQAKINVTSKSPVGDISVVTLIRTDTTLDHSQKAEKVCSLLERLTDIIEQKECAGESHARTLKS